MKRVRYYGQWVANPIATVVSGSLLFERLGEDAVVAGIRTLVADQLADSNAPGTPGVRGEATTMEVAADLERWLLE